MIKKFIIVLTILFISLKYSETSCINKIDNVNDIHFNSLHDKNIKIEIQNIDIINKMITLNKKYDRYAIITMNIINTSLEPMEMCNINYTAYQGNNKLETFIETNDNKYLGFIGILESGQCKKVKIGVSLYDYNLPMKLEFQNFCDIRKNKIIKVINLL